MKKYKIDDLIDIVNGIGKKRKTILNNNKIFTINDLLNFFPKKYEYKTKIYSIIELSLLKIKGCIKCKIHSIINEIFNKKTIIKIIAHDGKDYINIICFYNILSYIKKHNEYLFYGKVNLYQKKYYLMSPIIDNIENPKYLLNIEPKYNIKHLPTISNLILKKIIINIINDLNFNEILPNKIILYNNFPNKKDTLRILHSPNNKLEIYNAKKKILFEKVFIYYQKKIINITSKLKIKKAILLKDFEISEFIKKLNFQLNNSQLAVIKKILNTLKKNEILYELIQGDVGSGKTVIALLISYLISKNNYQVAIMVPTEILALQYYEKYKKIFKDLNIEICVFSKINKKNIQKIIPKILNGYYKIIIGTHILLNNNIIFKSLGLIIIDEQHKFGVNHRKKIIEKSEKYYTHIIIMTATPIPRTLALLEYTNFSHSIILNKPFTSKIHTLFILENNINKLVIFIKKKILTYNEQVYILCPSINSNLLNNTNNLCNFFNSKFNSNLINIGIYHSKLDIKDKINIMEKFKKNEINILITTTIIEVGIDIPNVTILLIYNPERFGLSQLHQIRGRIGRNNNKNNYCFLIIENKAKINNRLVIFQKCNNGFLISKYDMNLRGSGNILGTLQHGMLFNNNLLTLIHKQIIEYFYKKTLKYNIEIFKSNKNNLLFIDN